MSLYPARLDVGQDKVAQVNNTIITLDELEKKYNELLKIGISPEKMSKKQVLEMMIQNILLKDELSNSKIVLDRNQFNGLLDQVKMQYKQQMFQQNPKFEYSDEKFKNFVETEGKISYDKFEENIKDQVLMRQYIYKKAEPQIQKLNAKTYTSKSDFPIKVTNPQTGEVLVYNSLQEFYDKNIQEFIMPKNVELKHIFLATVIKGGKQKFPDAEIAIRKKKMEDILARIKKGESFDSMCEMNSEDYESRDRINPKTKKIDRGYLGTLLYTDETVKNEFGPAAFEAIFALKAGEISNVIESNVGFHIFYVIKKSDKPEILELSEVQDRIKEYLKFMEQNTILNETMEKVMTDLKKKASIVYFKDEYKN
jgi:parvulin-like peptidyl-prolyl isomerase